MSVLAKSDPVSGVIVSRVGELMDVRRVNDATGVNRHETIAGQGARIIISSYDIDAKSSISPVLFALFLA
jgi:hypothetical protein